MGKGGPKWRLEGMAERVHTYVDGMMTTLGCSPMGQLLARLNLAPLEDLRSLLLLRRPGILRLPRGGRGGGYASHSVRPALLPRRGWRGDACSTGESDSYRADMVLGGGACRLGIFIPLGAEGRVSW